jgi:hypothetical protein
LIQGPGEKENPARRDDYRLTQVLSSIRHAFPAIDHTGRLDKKLSIHRH